VTAGADATVDVTADDRRRAGAAGVVPIRALARDGDEGFVVHRAPAPPVTAGHRFRLASVPLARALRRLVADARAGGDAHALGAELRAALGDLRTLAESYDVGPAAAFFGRRGAGADALEPRTLAALDAAAAGLIEGRPVATPAAGAPDVPAGEPADAPEIPAAPAAAGADFFPTPAAGIEAAPPVVDREDASRPRPPTGPALVALLETGISSFGLIDTLEEAPTGPARVTGAPVTGAPVTAGAAAARADGADRPDAAPPRRAPRPPPRPRPTVSCPSRSSCTPAAPRSSARVPCATRSGRAPGRPTPPCWTSCTTCSTSRPADAWCGSTGRARSASC
jgi:hypothetical protein